VNQQFAETGWKSYAMILAMKASFYNFRYCKPVYQNISQVDEALGYGKYFDKKGSFRLGL
jgi:hypothetical protein